MRITTTALGSTMALAMANMAAAQESTLRMATIAPGLSAATTMSTFANIVSENLPGFSI